MESSETPEAPEGSETFKTLGSVWHFLRVNRDLLIKGPVLGAIAVVAISSYYFGVHESKGELNVLNDRVGFLNDQLVAYKDRLQGASPDQAAKQIAELRAALNSANKKLEVLMPDRARTLTEVQKKFISDHKEEFTKYTRLLAVFGWQSGDSLQYGKEFVDEFKKVTGNDIQGPTFASCQLDDRGIMVGLKDLNNPSENAKAFLQLLKTMGLKVSFTKWGFAGPSQEYDLFICGDSTDQSIGNLSSQEPPAQQIKN